MGCDIHVFTERKSKDMGWRCEDDFRLNPYFDKNSDDKSESEFMHNPCYRGRNYQLFSILAGVRGNDNIICEPKGLPDDLSEFVKSQNEYWGSDGHSHSYYSMDELMEVLISKRPDTKSGIDCLQRFVDCFVKKIENDNYWLNKDSENFSKVFSDYRIVFWFDN